MLKKKASRGAAAAMGYGDPRSPSPPTTKVTDGGRPASRLLSTRSLPSLFSTDGPMPEQSKNPPCSGIGRIVSSHCSGIGSPAAGLAGVLVTGEADDGGYRNHGRVLLGMRLRVQLPPPPPPGKGPGGGGDLLGSPIEFGVKNRDAQLALLSPVQRSPLSSAAARLARRSEVEELAEENYTCIIARGPNPRMTHIFEDRVVESRAGAGAGDGGGGDTCCFLSSCSGFKKDALTLHRGEREFCSSQCHYEEVLFGVDDSSDASVKLKP